MCVLIVRDLETSTIRQSSPKMGSSSTERDYVATCFLYTRVGSYISKVQAFFVAPVVTQYYWIFNFEVSNLDVTNRVLKLEVDILLFVSSSCCKESLR